MQELTSRMAELAVDDDDIELAWTITVTPINIVVAAATKELYPDEVAAWDGARQLWAKVLDVGYELTPEGQNETGVVQRPAQDGGWRGQVRLVLQPFRLN